MSEKIITIDGIEATLVRKKVKNIRVTIVPPEGTVRVTAPKMMPEARIIALLTDETDRIRTHVEQVRNAHANMPKQYVSGEMIRLFGQDYPLCVLENQKKNEVVFEPDAGRIVLSLKGDVPREKREAILNDWLREWLKYQIAYLMPLWSKRTGLVPSSWTIHNMTTRWGSCNPRTKKINLNLQLVHYPLPCLEYVILHELCHIKVYGHGTEFKALLDLYMPGWKARKEQLNR